MAKRESGTVSTRGIGVPKFNQEMLAATIAALAGITLVWTFSQPEFPVPVLIAAGAVFTVSIVMVIRLMMDPDSVRALQSDAMLQLASSMIDAMGDGLTEEASQEDSVGLINLENRSSITELSVRLTRGGAVRRLEDIAVARRRLAGNGNPVLVFEALFCSLIAR